MKYVAALLLGLLTQQGESTQLDPHGWTRAGEGSFVKHKVVQEQNGEKREMTETWTLVSKENYTLEVTQNIGKLSRKMIAPAQLIDLSRFKKIGTTTIKVGKNEVICDRYKFASEDSKIIHLLTVSRDPATPYMVLGRESHFSSEEQGDFSFLEKFLRTETVTVKGQQIECCVFSHEQTQGGNSVKAELWRSKLVPQVPIKSKATVTSEGETPFTVETTLEDFEIKK